VEKHNIQKRECQAIRKVFDAAKDPNKVMIVGIDAAKATHKAAICNGHGDQFCKTFNLRNDSEGVAFLHARIDGLCHKFSLLQEHVLVGFETPGSWAENFADTLVTEGLPVINMHPANVKKYRENATTDNDKLSAQTICRCLNQKEGSQRLVDDTYSELLMFSRHHGRLIRQRTQTTNRITTFCDMYFPGLLDTQKSGIPCFTEPGLKVLEKLSIHLVRKMSARQLAERLARYGLPKPQQKAQQLKQLSHKALAPTPEKERCMQFEINNLIQQYRLLCDQIDRAFQEMACLLRQTPLALLTTICGIGVSLAAQITAEVYGRDRHQGAEGKVNYAGLSARGLQTGGDQKPWKRQGKARKINRHAKRIILMASESVAIHDHGELTQYYQVRKLSGKNAKCALGRKLFRFCDKLLDAPQAYLPATLRDGCATPELLADYYTTLAEKLETKWKRVTKKPPRQQDVLEQWMDMICNLYHVDFGSIRNHSTSQETTTKRGQTQTAT